LFLHGNRLSATHVIAACAGFTGACIAIAGEKLTQSGLQGLLGAGFAWGYVPAAGSAFIWASYSLMSKRLASTGHGFPTAAIGLFGLVSGLLSLLCHALMEPPLALRGHDWALLTAMGLGPLGAAFFLWDAALKRGDARQIGILSYLTPLASTVLLIVVTGRALTWSIGFAASLIIGAAVLGTRGKI
jgi:drug/metabolite transporter (DMT)-like permease